MELITFVIVSVLLVLVYNSILTYKKNKNRADVIQHMIEEYEKNNQKKENEQNENNQIQSKNSVKISESKSDSKDLNDKKILVLFSSQRGTSNVFGTKLFHQLKKNTSNIQYVNMKKFDPEAITEKGETDILIIFVPTYTDGLPCEDGVAFYEWIQDLSLDFRVPRNLLSHLSIAIMGFGDSAFGEDRFCAVAKSFDKWFKRLGANELVPTELGNNAAGNDINEQFEKFKKNVHEAIFQHKLSEMVQTTQTKISKSALNESDTEEEGEDMLDIEDMGKVVKKEGSSEIDSSQETPEMLTPLLRKSLEKQGYKLFGSHSGVKLCRWTKAMLRGRGGCYKHTAYGITSYRCMEMTPSLACASKCVFCWRHHSNPVARSWKWKVDEPEFLIENAIKNHVQMINSLKGVPGVQQDRFEEAFVPKHCALSLVGEPIIYPYIGKFLDLLHEKKISSFLVTNAQFPEQMEAVDKVTQIYISVDASNPESLKKIDRPIFEDYWERFLACIDLMKKKKMRTVFRLTLVKSWNMNEMQEYISLIRRGEPMFIEIKGVTFCGNSQSSDLTMKNVPFHEEVKDFAFKICEMAGMEDYEPACIHEHSCFVLLAQKRFKINGEWHTWIDYDKFHELVQSGEDFGAMDYIAKTPEWALIESKEQGFDPVEERFIRKSQKAKSSTNTDESYANGGC